MVLVADELKKKRADLGAQIEELRIQIAALEQQQIAFDLVIRTYEPDYMPDTSGAVRRSKRVAPSPNSITQLFMGFARRSFVLRTLRKAESPMSTADFARVFATETGLAEDDVRLGQSCSALLPLTEFTENHVAVRMSRKGIFRKAKTVPVVTENSRRHA